MEIKVSVIIPNYNTGAYIKECLESVMNQTLIDIEIIVIDDASTDNSLDVIYNKQKSDNRIKVLSLDENTPGGAGIPSNVGIREAGGKYIGFVDSDDVIEPGMFESLYKAAVEFNSDFSCCNFDLLNDRTHKISPANDQIYFMPLSKELCLSEDIELTSKLIKISPVPWRKLYRREFLVGNDLYFPEGDFFFEDTPLHYKAVLKANRVAVVKDILYHHRIFRSEQTMYGKGDKFFAFILHTDNIYRFMVQEDYFDLYYHIFFSFCTNSFSWIWNRLNRREREIYYRKLKALLLTIPLEHFHKYEKNNSRWDYLLIESIVHGRYRNYKKLVIIQKLYLVIPYLYFLSIKRIGLRQSIQKYYHLKKNSK